MVKRGFRYLAIMRIHFWKKWRKEYLRNLRKHKRGKKGRNSTGVNMGDVVLVFDENLKKGCWKMGRVESLMFGRDQEVRGAKVKVIIKGNPVYINRLLQKLYLLEVSENEKRAGRNDERCEEMKGKE